MVVVVVDVGDVSDVVEVPEVSEGDVVEVSDSPGMPYSVVMGRRLEVVRVVVDSVVFTVVDVKVGGTKSIGASSGPPDPVSAIAAHTTRPITARAAALAPATAGVE
ncbi:hypothetical protein A5722_25680 [Mycobacterium vulneris]|nr:hypothetical protein A5722_25680 [Mycolicibacterium vulneris]OCB63945.1 hypothetical protein A5729_22700 [Mycolicibacterium vulneris]